MLARDNDTQTRWCKSTSFAHGWRAQDSLSGGMLRARGMDDSRPRISGGGRALDPSVECPGHPFSSDLITNLSSKVNVEVVSLAKYLRPATKASAFAVA